MSHTIKKMTWRSLEGAHLDLDFFIVVVFCEIVHTGLDSGESERTYEDAARRVMWLRALVDTDAFAIRYVAYLRHVLAEAR